MTSLISSRPTSQRSRPSKKALHSNVVLPLLRLFAIILQLPDEDYLANQHSYDRNSTDHFRYMIYHSRTKDQWAEAKNGATGGHTDLGTLTLLFRQPVTGLQILGEDGSWTWVSAQPGTITGSPVLEAAGVRPRFDKIVTSEEWVRAKQRLQLNPEIAAKRWAERGDGTVEVLVGLRDQRYKE